MNRLLIRCYRPIIAGVMRWEVTILADWSGAGGFALPGKPAGQRVHADAE